MWGQESMYANGTFFLLLCTAGITRKITCETQRKKNITCQSETRVFLKNYLFPFTTWVPTSFTALSEDTSVAEKSEEVVRGTGCVLVQDGIGLELPCPRSGLNAETGLVHVCNIERAAVLSSAPPFQEAWRDSQFNKGSVCASNYCCIFTIPCLA